MIAEALIVGQRLPGGIDTDNYQVRISELAWQAVADRGAGRNP
ncbi:hypothetical protein DSM43518_03711 [Mycobacterium marinum]|nr:hypothetical protein DSM43518_03711 [Mycobacterium marinum]RFZ46780.1 hypothetical protein MSS4_03438 [Mycobacterium marinum]